MAQIANAVTQTGQPSVTVRLNLSDSDMDLVIQSYQQDANIAVNGTATRDQVIQFMFGDLVTKQIQAKVQSHATVPAVVPPPINISIP